MATFPTGIDDGLHSPSTGDTIAATDVANLVTTVLALEAKVGINNSAVTTSHDYLLTHLPAQNSAADWDAGAINITAENFTSDIATGTRPFIVTSTTACTNLNADMVDGKHVAGTNGAGEITTNDGTQTLTAKTLTSPDINGGTWNGTIDGNWTAASQTCANLGAVTTCDINGGAIDGAIIGAASAAAGTFAALTCTTLTATGNILLGDGADTLGVNCSAGITYTPAATWTFTAAQTVSGTWANLGTVTTVDINGGTVDGTNVGATTPGTGKFTTLEATTTLKLGTTNQGDILYDNGTSLVRLTPGTSGYFLKTQGAGANPAWAANTNTSNALFEWHGTADWITDDTGVSLGTSTSVNDADPVYCMYLTGKSTSYETVFRTKYKKISGVSTVTFYAYMQAGANYAASIQLNIGGLTGAVSTTAPHTTSQWITADIDVSSLSNGTVYDVLVQLKRESDAATPVGLFDLIAFGA